MKNNMAMRAINAVIEDKLAYCKFLSSNDSGETGAHQSGILISKKAKDLFWTEQEMKEHSILKKYGHIYWQGEDKTTCTLTWYKSKNEIRLTGFGRGRSPLHARLTGALFVLIKKNDEEYSGFLLNADNEIEEFLDFFGLSPADTNRLIVINRNDSIIKETQAINTFIDSLDVDFPTSYEMSAAARKIQEEVYLNRNLAITNPDKILLQWTDQEYKLFRAIEHDRYGKEVASGFSSVDDFIAMANKVLNRRKSRAGRSLEHHLGAIFDNNKIKYTAQAVTEGNKKPDFIFPSEKAYHDATFPITRLCMLAAKTTCKDRWRQILNEADRLRDDNKYLCTLQQGISAKQMDEMQKEKVILVVPKVYHSAYPKERRHRIWTLGKFLAYVKEIER